ncbi:hypothetical protein PCE1_003096 [Barthelona sp. PCE]
MLSTQLDFEDENELRTISTTQMVNVEEEPQEEQRMSFAERYGELFKKYSESADIFGIDITGILETFRNQAEEINAELNYFVRAAWIIESSAFQYARKVETLSKRVNKLQTQLYGVFTDSSLNEEETKENGGKKGKRRNKDGFCKGNHSEINLKKSPLSVFNDITKKRVPFLIRSSANVSTQTHRQKLLNCDLLRADFVETGVLDIIKHYSFSTSIDPVLLNPQIPESTKTEKSLEEIQSEETVDIEQMAIRSSSFIDYKTPVRGVATPRAPLTERTPGGPAGLFEVENYVASEAVASEAVESEDSVQPVDDDVIPDIPDFDIMDSIDVDPDNSTPLLMTPVPVVEKPKPTRVLPQKMRDDARESQEKAFALYEPHVVQKSKPFVLGNIPEKPDFLKHIQQEKRKTKDIQKLLTNVKRSTLFNVELEPFFRKIQKRQRKEKAAFRRKKMKEERDRVAESGEDDVEAVEVPAVSLTSIFANVTPGNIPKKASLVSDLTEEPSNEFFNIDDDDTLSYNKNDAERTPMPRIRLDLTAETEETPMKQDSRMREYYVKLMEARAEQISRQKRVRWQERVDTWRNKLELRMEKEKRRRHFDITQYRTEIAQDIAIKLEHKQEAEKTVNEERDVESENIDSEEENYNPLAEMEGFEEYSSSRKDKRERFVVNNTISLQNVFEDKSREDISRNFLTMLQLCNEGRISMDEDDVVVLENTDKLKNLELLDLDLSDGE